MILLLLLGILVLILSIPSVQSSLAKRITKSVNTKYGTSIYVNKLGLKWNGDLNLKDVYIQDHHQDTLIYARSLATSIISVKKLMDENFELGDISIDEGRFFLKRYAGEQSDNISIFAKKFIPKKPSSGGEFVMSSSQVSLTNGHFKYIDEELGNPVAVDYSSLNATLEDFDLVNDVVNAHIDELSFKAARGYEIKTLEGDFHYGPESIMLKEFDLETAHSSLQGDLEMDISGDKMSEFTNLVEIKAAFAKAEVSTNDIEPFYKGFNEDVVLFLEGTLEGTLNNFETKDIWVRGLSNSMIQGDIQFRNLINEKEIVIDGKYNEVRTSYFDLKKLMPDIFKTLPGELTKLGAVKFKGTSQVTENNLVTKGVFITKLGNADVDVTLSNFQNTAEASYTGHVTLNEFELGNFIDDERVGTTTMDLDIDGKGFIQESLDTKLSGKVVNLAYNGYNYKNITVFGNLNTPKFNGEILIKDPNVKGSLNGLIDVSATTNTYDFEADIDYLNLHALHLVKDSISVVKGNVIMDMSGTGIEDAAGTLSFANTSYETKVDTLSLIHI